jgi:hypothetical protein
VIQSCVADPGYCPDWQEIAGFRRFGFGIRAYIHSVKTAARYNSVVDEGETDRSVTGCEFALSPFLGRHDKQPFLA